MGARGRQDPARRRACQTYALTIGVAQTGWVLLLMLRDSTIGEFDASGALSLLIEIVGPVIAARGKGGTPWHAHHLAERYALLTIITLGEGVIGTVASLGAVVEPQGWTPRNHDRLATDPWPKPRRSAVP